ncbi:acetoin dehydrogenase dihydrolipoyllysine-residue acetyltransferase subunit [Streptomyces sp. NPDC050844]|uniref:acetoin dehydrogenase dihydrolipoyllysine-residue acetyltransferase subunit n=1 Tax=Streptomyces sp. NPDC050844 TaxID=3155790 RepID=UPI0033E8736D
MQGTQGMSLVERVTMPKWGLPMKTGKITEWIAREGDEVEEGDDLAEIDTDKIAGTLEAPSGGVLRRIVAEAGGEAPVGCVIAVIAPAEVPEGEIERVVAEAREQLARGVPAEDEASPVGGLAEVDGRALAYATSGAGPEEIVLVHGYGGDKNSWLFVQEPLAARHTVYALDLPGHGESGKDVGAGGLDALTDVVAGFLDALGIERAHLVGHSLGGAVVTAVAARVPERVRSLTLIAPAGYGPEVDASYLRGFAAAGTRRELRPHLGKLFADEGLVTRQLVDDLLKYKRLDGVDVALRTLLTTLLDEDDAPALDVRHLLPAALRVVAVWGRDDRVIPASNATSLAGRASVRVVDGVGHLAQMEAPGEVVAAVERAVSG